MVDETSLEATLVSVFKTVGGGLADLLVKASGLDDDPDSLPIDFVSPYNFATARFFSNPAILLEESADNSTFAGTWSNFIPNIVRLWPPLQVY